MSHSGNPIGDLGLDSLSDQLRDSLCSLEANKPDFRELDLGSPVSPLRTRGLNTTATTTTTTTSSSSSSSGSVSGSRNVHNQGLKSNHSGELSNSCETSPTRHGNEQSEFQDGRFGIGNWKLRAWKHNAGWWDEMTKANLDAGHSVGTSASTVRGNVGGQGWAVWIRRRAIALAPGNAAYRSNRAAALMGLGRVAEAVRECEEAVRLGQVENARRHLYFPGYHPDPSELQKLQLVEKHLNKCSDARKVNDWKNALREGEAAIAAGADYSPQLFMCRAEAHLKLHQLEDAEACLSNIPKLEPYSNSCAQSRFFGMLSEAYTFLVQAQIEMAMGRFENALTVAEKAGQIDPRNVEIAVLLHNVRLVARARARGNELFKSERYTEACSAYGEGLRLDPSNSVLYCNRAACWFKLGLWERSIDDCNQALRIQPNYAKALLRRAASNSKLERWAAAVRDYEVLRRELPNDNEVAESLFHAQVALKKSRGEEVYNMKFGGEVEEVLDLSSSELQYLCLSCVTGVSVVHFKSSSNLHCKQISPFVDTLCGRYPSINFLKVDIENNPAVANAENVRIVPTFKIYKNGSRVKEIVCPSHDMLEHSVRHYSF
ncbi:hypothetical protein GH714_039638 [Hevea brasiliensis]|uniref:Thioredoxin domain-containing protein n=1 Tax=Hevea brasiliensis TaxID=3981 RepID=A0A6A6KHE7_HEVBR|nr:hypothetical protein GH714_039638 [Hevea brasiliensis]